MNDREFPAFAPICISTAHHRLCTKCADQAYLMQPHLDMCFVSTKPHILIEGVLLPYAKADVVPYIEEGIKDAAQQKAAKLVFI